MSDRYELIERIATGTSGTVYRARDAGGEVALKMLHPHLVSDLVVRNRFMREAELLSKIRHPHIVRVHDVVEIDSQPALVMELLTGGSLRGRILSSSDARVLLRELAGALAEIHSRGIVHRDLRPEHVLFDADDRSRIVDFGMASVKDLSGLTRSTVFTARPEFVDPFTWGRGRPLPAQDIYSLGALIFTALVGKPPPVSIFGRTAAPERERALAAMEERADSNLRDLVTAMLDAPDRRPRSAAEIMDWVESGPSEGRRLTQCIHCGAAMPVDAPVCLDCHREPLQVALDPDGYYLALRKVSEEKEILGPFLAKLRLLADGPAGDIKLILGDARLYSRAEQKAGLRLPVRIADGVHSSSLDGLIEVLTGDAGSAIRIVPYPMSRVARNKRGPLVKLREGRVLPEKVTSTLRSLGRPAPGRPEGGLRKECRYALSIAAATLAADPSTANLVDDQHLSGLWAKLNAAVTRLEETFADLERVRLQDLYADLERLESAEGPEAPSREKERDRLLALFGEFAATEREAAALEQRVVRVCRLLESITPPRAVEQLRAVEAALSESRAAGA